MAGSRDADPCQVLRHHSSLLFRDSGVPSSCDGGKCVYDVTPGCAAFYAA